MDFLMSFGHKLIKNLILTLIWATVRLALFSVPCPGSCYRLLLSHLAVAQKIANRSCSTFFSLSHRDILGGSQIRSDLVHPDQGPGMVLVRIRIRRPEGTASVWPAAKLPNLFQIFVLFTFFVAVYKRLNSRTAVASHTQNSIRSCGLSLQRPGFFLSKKRQGLLKDCIRNQRNKCTETSKGKKLGKRLSSFCKAVSPSDLSFSRESFE